MGILDYFSSSPKPAVKGEAATDTNGHAQVVPESVSAVIIPEPRAEPKAASDGPPDAQTSAAENADNTAVVEPSRIPLPVSPPSAPERRRRFSLRPFSLQTHGEEKHRHTLSAAEEKKEREHASEALARRLAKPLSFNSDKRAKQSALIVRALIVGPPSLAAPKVTAETARPQLGKVKSLLLEPRSANKVIAELRMLDPLGEDADEKDKKSSRGPIHAVCLDKTDAEVHELHFKKLAAIQTEKDSDKISAVASMASVSLDALAAMIQEMHPVSLITAPNLGLGQPGDGEGLLAGAVPTAETVITGIEQITPQLMALGYATGRAIMPDHKGVYPPKDRVSVLTYWWGLEVTLPPPTLVYLTNTQSVSNSIMTFLSALSAINNGVREILPFVRYISQYIDFEFNSIKAQNRGRGVVCAATWIMPAAMVPRPWDFDDPPPPQTAVAQPAPSSSKAIDKSPQLGQPAGNVTSPLPVPVLPFATVPIPNGDPVPAQAIAAPATLPTIDSATPESKPVVNLLLATPA